MLVPLVKLCARSGRRNFQWNRVGVRKSPGEKLVGSDEFFTDSDEKLVGYKGVVSLAKFVVGMVVSESRLVKDWLVVEDDYLTMMEAAGHKLLT